MKFYRFRRGKTYFKRINDYLNKKEKRKENSGRTIILDGYDEIHAIILQERYSFLNSFFRNIVLRQCQALRKGFCH